MARECFTQSSRWIQGQPLCRGLVSARWLYLLPNGDVLVAEASTKPKPLKTEEDKEKQRLLRQAGNVRESADRITLLRDSDGDGVAEHRSVLLSALNQPFGMLYLNGSLYVANTDGVLRFPWDGKQAPILAKGQKILELPAGGYNNHWTRNLIANAAGNKLYVTVGSASNGAEHGIQEEKRRAKRLEINPDGSGERIYASGLRNPNGMDWQPGTTTLWTAVNERDNIGDDLVPDYITSVREGGFYGWPWSYFGRNVDGRIQPQRPEVVQKAIVPDFALGPYRFAGPRLLQGNSIPRALPRRYAHRTARVVEPDRIFRLQGCVLPFRNGRPVEPVEDFLTGFPRGSGDWGTNGRPAGVTVDRTEALLVADDTVM